MRMLKLSTYVLVSTLSCQLISCSTGKVAETTSTDSTTVITEETEAVAQEEATAATPSDEIRLKGIYVTSIRMPHDQNDYQNLFDGNEKTFWATMPSAGPDEGIMLYFNSPVSVSKLEIKQPAGETFSTILR